MSRYIDADFLKSVLRKKAKQEMNMTTMPYSWSFAYECFAESIDSIPTADVEPVRHGHWKSITNAGTIWIVECSECGVRAFVTAELDKYCPHCGAKMDGKETTDADTV